MINLSAWSTWVAYLFGIVDFFKKYSTFINQSHNTKSWVFLNTQIEYLSGKILNLSETGGDKS